MSDDEALSLVLKDEDYDLFQSSQKHLQNSQELEDILLQEKEGQTSKNRPNTRALTKSDLNDLESQVFKLDGSSKEHFSDSDSDSTTLSLCPKNIKTNRKRIQIFSSDSEASGSVYHPSQESVNSEEGRFCHFCDICGQGFHNDEEYSEHFFHCRICDVKFHSKLSLKEHETMHNADEEGLKQKLTETIECDVCHAKDIPIDDLWQHLKSHEQEVNSSKTFNCMKCTKSFNKKGNLSGDVWPKPQVNHPHDCDCADCTFLYMLLPQETIDLEEDIIIVPSSPTSSTTTLCVSDSDSDDQVSYDEELQINVNIFTKVQDVIDIDEDIVLGVHSPYSPLPCPSMFPESTHLSIPNHMYGVDTPLSPPSSP